MTYSEFERVNTIHPNDYTALCFFPIFNDLEINLQNEIRNFLNDKSITIEEKTDFSRKGREIFTYNIDKVYETISEFKEYRVIQQKICEYYYEKINQGTILKEFKFKFAIFNYLDDTKEKELILELLYMYLSPRYDVLKSRTQFKELILKYSETMKEENFKIFVERCFTSSNYNDFIYFYLKFKSIKNNISELYYQKNIRFIIRECIKVFDFLAFFHPAYIFTLSKELTDMFSEQSLFETHSDMPKNNFFESDISKESFAKFLQNFNNYNYFISFCNRNNVIFIVNNFYKINIKSLNTKFIDSIPAFKKILGLEEINLNADIQKDNIYFVRDLLPDFFRYCIKNNKVIDIKAFGEWINNSYLSDNEFLDKLIKNLITLCLAIDTSGNIKNEILGFTKSIIKDFSFFIKEQQEIVFEELLSTCFEYALKNKLPLAYDSYQICRILKTIFENYANQTNTDSTFDYWLKFFSELTLVSAPKASPKNNLSVDFIDSKLVQQKKTISNLGTAQFSELKHKEDIYNSDLNLIEQQLQSFQIEEKLKEFLNHLLEIANKKKLDVFRKLFKYCFFKSPSASELQNLCYFFEENIDTNIKFQKLSHYFNNLNQPKNNLNQDALSTAGIAGFIAKTLVKIAKHKDLRKFARSQALLNRLGFRSEVTDPFSLTGALDLSVTAENAEIAENFHKAWLAICSPLAPLLREWFQQLPKETNWLIIGYRLLVPFLIASVIIALGFLFISYFVSMPAIFELLMIIPLTYFGFFTASMFIFVRDCAYESIINFTYNGFYNRPEFQYSKVLEHFCEADLPLEGDFFLPDFKINLIALKSKVANKLASSIHKYYISEIENCDKLSKEYSNDDAKKRIIEDRYGNLLKEWIVISTAKINNQETFGKKEILNIVKRRMDLDSSPWIDLNSGERNTYILDILAKNPQDAFDSEISEIERLLPNSKKEYSRIENLSQIKKLFIIKEKLGTFKISESQIECIEENNNVFLTYAKSQNYSQQNRKYIEDKLYWDPAKNALQRQDGTFQIHSTEYLENKFNLDKENFDKLLNCKEIYIQNIKPSRPIPKNGGQISRDCRFFYTKDEKEAQQNNETYSKETNFSI